jgi:GAF domain-containing protein
VEDLVELVGSKDLFESVVDTAVEIACADFGNIQLIDPVSGDLKIVAQRGFSSSWVAFWDSQSSGRGACGSALYSRRRVIVEDVSESSVFNETERSMQLEAGVRAIQSTPLFSKKGEPIGVFSTHYRKPWRPTGSILRTLDSLARLVASAIELKKNN